MTILLIDTCQQGLSLGLKTNDAFYHYEHHDYKQQSSLLLTEIDHLLQKGDCKPNNITFIAVTHGPGPFTGVRVGVSATKALALAWEVPVVTVSSLQCLAQTAARISGATSILVARDARMQEMYVGRYHLGKSAIMLAEQEFLCAPEALTFAPSTMMVAGDAWQVYEARLPKLTHSGVYLAELDDLLVIAEAKWQAGEVCQAETLMPVYLRDNVVS